MSHSLPSPLPPFDRWLLGRTGKLVPPSEREDWLRTWQAELWCMRHGRRRSRLQSVRLSVDLSFGLVRDALWLRGENWRCALTGTPALCLGTLFAFCILCAGTDVLLSGGWHLAGRRLGFQAVRCLLAAPLVLLVTTATASSRHIDPSATGTAHRWRRRIFFTVKTALALLLTFLLSAGLCEPLHTSFPPAADLLQIFAFVIFSIFALRWSFHDQETRCKQCLRSLTTPERVGRPSHNLLEWTGTEQICRRGHGTLSVPEMETSWRQYSQWFAQDAEALNQPAGI